MDTKALNEMGRLSLIAERIREMRDILGFSVEEMAEKTEVSKEEYELYEQGKTDMPFTFLHKCSLVLGIQLMELLEGSSAHLSSYTVTRKGKGENTAEEDGIIIQNMAPNFKKKIGEPYYVTYKYSEALQGKPIHLTKHDGQEFDFIVSGSLLVQIGSKQELLHEGDSIFYNSSTPHGMIAVDGKDCVFIAMILPGEKVAGHLEPGAALPRAAYMRVGYYARRPQRLFRAGRPNRGKRAGGCDKRFPGDFHRTALSAISAFPRGRTASIRLS